MIIVAVKCEGCGRTFGHREFTEEIIDELVEGLSEKRHLCIECSMRTKEEAKPLWEDITLDNGVTIRLCMAPSMTAMAFVCPKSFFERGEDICKYYKTRDIDDTEFATCCFVEDDEEI